MADTTPTTTDTTKSVFASTTVWGIVISIIPTILGIFHITVGAGFGDSVNSLVAAGTTLVGAAVAFWGRIKATRSLVILPPKA